MEFMLSHVVKNVSSLKEDELHESNTKEHFNVPWKLRVFRKGEFLAFYLYNELPSEPEWSIQIEQTLKIITTTGKSSSKNGPGTLISKTADIYIVGWPEFIKWEEMEKDYLVDGNLVVEAHVKILKMTGIQKKPLRKFDESTKHFSDIVLITEGEKFYISKLFLASKSIYFEALFLKEFKESEKSEITLKDVSAKDLQKFLELLYGESSIDEDTVEGILKLADTYDAKLAIHECEQFLIKESEKSLKEKLKMVKLFRLKNLKHFCLSKINTVEDIRSVLVYDPCEMDPSVVGALLGKSLSLHK